MWCVYVAATNSVIVSVVYQLDSIRLCQMARALEGGLLLIYLEL